MLVVLDMLLKFILDIRFHMLKLEEFDNSSHDEDVIHLVPRLH